MLLTESRSGEILPHFQNVKKLSKCHCQLFSVSAEAANNKGRSPLHEFARFSENYFYSVRDISLGRFTEKNAVEMLELFLECMPEYNIDRPDGDGKP